MAVGDQQDMAARIRAAIPSRWFPVTGATDPASSTPVLDGVLAGLGAAWAWFYSMVEYLVLQGRIATSTDVWLDIIAVDFFGTNLQRQLNETDIAFSLRIRQAILAPKNTRAAMVKALVALTGRTPKIFEPRNTTDTGGYGHTGMTVGTGLGYGVAGGYGSMVLPFQFFLTAYRPSGGGISNVMGYYLGSGWAGGGYGVGAIEYASTSMLAGQVTDAAIQATVSATRPVATIGWMNISS